MTGSECTLRCAIGTFITVGIALADYSTAQAQSYPAKPIHIVVPFAAGGITDIVTRALGQRLSETWKEQVIVENRPGGGTGQIGTQQVARSSPDGYTLLITSDAGFTTAPHMTSKLPYDAENDFVPITALGISPQALVVHPSLPVSTLKELVAYAKEKPGEINYGTFGIGSSGHLNIIMIESLTGTKFTAVHYRGAAPAINDLVGGHIQMMIVSIGLIAQPWQAGALKVLGFGSTSRIDRFPDVPTLAERGLPGFEAGSWYGLFAPKNTPREIVTKLNAETQRIFNDPGFRARFLEPSFICSLVSSPEAFSERIKAESAAWRKVIQDSKVPVE